MGLFVFNSVLFCVSIITITFVAGVREAKCSSSSTTRRSTCVSRMRQTEYSDENVMLKVGGSQFQGGDGMIIIIGIISNYYYH